jgi:hypothetical protein
LLLFDIFMVTMAALKGADQFFQGGPDLIGTPADLALDCALRCEIERFGGSHRGSAEDGTK